MSDDVEGFPSEYVANSQSSETLDEEYMEAFAEQLLRHPKEPMVAAAKVFPGAPWLQTLAVTRWVFSPKIAEISKNLIDKYGEEYFLPTRFEFLSKVWQKMNEAYIEPRDFCKLAEVYGKARSFFPDEKANANLNIDVGNVNIVKVMNIPTHSSDSDWEAQLLAQQRKLISDGG